MYKVGQISRATGISVRTLHYYDKLGILKPTAVSESGYRFYSGDDLMKLQQIIVFKRLGFSLAKIQPLLTAYAVWTGIGTAGASVVGILLFQESRNSLRLLCIGGVIACVIGLKMVG